MILSKGAICDSKKSKFIKEQEAKELLSNLGIRIPLTKIPLLGDIFFLNATPLNAIPLEKDERIMYKKYYLKMLLKNVILLCVEKIQKALVHWFQKL